MSTHLSQDLTTLDQHDPVCAPDPDCDCQLASDHLSYGLVQSLQDLIASHVMSRAT